MSFLKIAQQSFVCEYFLAIPIDVPKFKLIEGQIKELQGMVPTPRAQNDQKSKGKIGLIFLIVFVKSIDVSMGTDFRYAPEELIC